MSDRHQSRYGQIDITTILSDRHGTAIPQSLLSDRHETATLSDRHGTATLSDRQDTVKHYQTDITHIDMTQPHTVR